MRKLVIVQHAPRPHWVGDGFPVRSMFSPQTHGALLSPFILLDYAPPTAFAPAPQKRGVGVHPHRGFETVTIVYSGEVDHRDSTGNGGHIGPGDVQWMTAASGILHEEFHSAAFTKNGGTMEMVQLWVNLPAKDKMGPPGYQTLMDGEIPQVELAHGAGRVRVIAGEYAGARGSARTFTPINIWDVRLSAGAKASFDVPEGYTLAVLVQSGAVKLNGDDVAREAQFAIFEREGGAIELEAQSDAKVLILSGEPIDEPVAWYGPFVMNTQAELRQAVTDFNAGKFGDVRAFA
ncbi:pirin family protein [Candidatus Viadribacter manganicus]|uniref:Quercetin 2,3-dioxygenase n=1 Tax=Candidatus Viadribacter manganicus TaxID=1759059 RepID=A0A1B1AEH7_9PROT|nr:pirin family protein [Candidatus Viadribacter manganicus]ANP44956.1 quercetin 2,3-dioxygenase [Candidatus Viadribacter manganicus]